MRCGLDQGETDGGGSHPTKGPGFHQEVPVASVPNKQYTPSTGSARVLLFRALTGSFRRAGPIRGRQSSEFSDQAADAVESKQHWRGLLQKFGASDLNWPRLHHPGRSRS